MLLGIKQRAEHLTFNPDLGRQNRVASLSGVSSG
jgi:hypothetical protein